MIIIIFILSRNGLLDLALWSLDLRFIVMVVSLLLLLLLLSNHYVHVDHLLLNEINFRFYHRN